MAIRKIVEIDESKCDGCGDCVMSCAEGAIQIIDGKAKVVNDSLCDGFGVCLGECPQGAISIIEREAPEYDEEAVKKHLAGLNRKHEEKPQPNPQQLHTIGAVGGGCPGSAMRRFEKLNTPHKMSGHVNIQSELQQWPVQMMLVPPHAPFLKNADILVCADCVPFAVPDFHSRYLAGRALLVGCPKLDNLDFYFEKFKEIFKTARPQRLTVVKMEVPCCTGIAQAVIQARNEIAPEIPVDVYTVGIQGGDIREQYPAGKVA
ncbi:MAG: 4Fe-4S binding protein [Candidatus Zixiibacteriota bacterium]